MQTFCAWWGIGRAPVQQLRFRLTRSVRGYATDTEALYVTTPAMLTDEWSDVARVHAHAGASRPKDATVHDQSKITVQTRKKGHTIPCHVLQCAQHSKMAFVNFFEYLHGENNDSTLCRVFSP